MNGVSKIDRIANKELRQRLDTESIQEIMDRRRMQWLEKLVNVPATQSDSRFPRMLFGAWIYQGYKQTRMRSPVKESPQLFLEIITRKFKFDDKDPILGLKYGELKNIIELICNEPAQFNLRVDYRLHSDIRDFF